MLVSTTARTAETEEESCLGRALWGFRDREGLFLSRFHTDLSSHRLEKYSRIHSQGTCVGYLKTDCSYMLSRAEHIRQWQIGPLGFSGTVTDLNLRIF